MTRSMRPPRPREADKTTPQERFARYGKTITAKAFNALIHRRPDPDCARNAEIAVHLAYNGGLERAHRLTLGEIESEGTRLGVAICDLLDKRKIVQFETGLSAAEFLYQVYRDDSHLQRIWGFFPELADKVACWNGINDVYEFVACFHNHAPHQDDARDILPTVEKSLQSRDLLDLWRDAGAVTDRAIHPSSLVALLQRTTPKLRLAS